MNTSAASSTLADNSTRQTGEHISARGSSRYLGLLPSGWSSSRSWLRQPENPCHCGRLRSEILAEHSSLTAGVSQFTAYTGCLLARDASMLSPEIKPCTSTIKEVFQ